MLRQVMTSSLFDPPLTTDHLWLTIFWFSAQQPEAGVGKKCASELTIFSHFTKFWLSAQPNPVGGKNVCPGIINFFCLQLQQIWVHEYKPKYHVPRFCSPTPNSQNAIHEKNMIGLHNIAKKILFGSHKRYTIQCLRIISYSSTQNIKIPPWHCIRATKKVQNLFDSLVWPTWHDTNMRGETPLDI